MGRKEVERYRSHTAWTSGEMGFSGSFTAA